MSQRKLAERSFLIYEAYEQYQETLDLSKSPKDRHDVYKSLVSFCEGKGQLSKALEYTNLRLSEGEKFQPPALVLMQKLQNLDKHVMAGQIDYALRQLDEIKAQTKPPFDKALPLGYLKVYLALEDTENAQEAVAGVEILIKTFQLEALRPVVLNAQGTIYELRGEYDRAIQSFQQQLELDPTDVSINRDIGSCYRKSSDFKRAEQYLKKNLRIFPFDPQANYEMALLYSAMRREESALQHLKQAIRGWDGADPEFETANEARLKLVEWEAIGRATESD